MEVGRLQFGVRVITRGISVLFCAEDAFFDRRPVGPKLLELRWEHGW